MSVLKTLREQIAPELNHLYTCPPTETAGAVDLGWNAREHAFHTFLVAKLFGAPAEICTGDFAVLSRFVPPLTSVGTGKDHAWCNINEVVPVDLSMNFIQYHTAPQLRAPIVGEGRNGDWHVQYEYDESPLDENIQNANEIIYIERAVSECSPGALLSNPSQFLPARDASDSQSARYGAAIYAQVTLHCFECAVGRAKSIRHRMKREEAFAWIASNYPDAELRLAEKLRKQVRSSVQ
jgi:hypothetical protein